jgi:hypothetical protein
MIIKACKFKRTKGSTWEAGISFELNGISDNARDAEKVYTEEGAVEEIYAIEDCLVDLCIDVKGILNNIK